MVQLDKINLISQILDLSLGGINRTYVGQHLGLTTKQLDSYFSLISEIGLAHVTEDYCETTGAGACFINAYRKLPKDLK